MNILTFFLISKNYINYDIINFLLQTHIYLTVLLFFLNHCIYKRYNSRQLSSMKGIINIAPKLGNVIIITVFLLIGFPLTIKFFIEFLLFFKFFNFKTFIFFTIVFAV